MFLVEDSSKAILYTGDIRAESWWVNSIAREPNMLKYTSGIRRLDCVYLDTTFATKNRVYHSFPTKAEGLAELLRKVERYPADTVFHFAAWTFGYEDVWIALCGFLDTPMHLDRYKWTLYNSLSRIKHSEPQAPEAHRLLGYLCGNHKQSGVLTSQHDTRLHSCEWFTKCPAVSDNKDVVKIFPIITRTESGVEVREEGAGGGKGDLNPSHELELDSAMLGRVLQACASKITDQELLAKIAVLLSTSLGERLKVDPEIFAEANEDEDGDPDEIPVLKFVDSLVRLVSKQEQRADSPPFAASGNVLNDITGPLPKRITFPHSRHSSYGELRHLISLLTPRDIYPCVVDESGWHPDISMETLFGDCLQGNSCAWNHDKLMHSRRRDKEAITIDSTEDEDENPETQNTREDESTEDELEPTGPDSASVQLHREAMEIAPHSMLAEMDAGPSVPTIQSEDTQNPKTINQAIETRQADQTRHDHSHSPRVSRRSASEGIAKPGPASPARHTRSIQRWAQIMAKGRDGFDWTDFGGLASVDQEDETDDDEL